MYHIAELIFEVLQLRVFVYFEAVVFVVSLWLLVMSLFRRDNR